MLSYNIFAWGSNAIMFWYLFEVSSTFLLQWGEAARFALAFPIPGKLHPGGDKPFPVHGVRYTLLKWSRKSRILWFLSLTFQKVFYPAQTLTWGQNGNWRISCFFFSSFLFFSIFVNWASPFWFLGSGVGKERKKSRRKKLGEWEKGKTKEIMRRVVLCSSA